MSDKQLTIQENQIIRGLADHDMKVSTAARAATYHSNTLHYHFMRIEQKTGLNPKKFYDLVKLLGEDVGTNTSHKERQAIYAEAIKKYGKEAQIKKAVEELSELLVEILHYTDERGSQEALVDELADATIMCEQLRRIFGIEDEVCARIDYKINRLKGRLGIVPMNEDEI